MLEPPSELNPATAPLTRAPLGVVGKAAAWVTSARGWRHRALVFTAGAVSTLAFAPFFAWPVLFLTFPLFVWLADGVADAARPKRATALAWWWFGFGYFFTGLLWVGEAFLVEAEIFAWLLPFAVTLLPAGLALFWALAGGIAAAVWPARHQRALRHDVARVLIVAVTIGCAEWLRGHMFTGLPWNTPGIALTMPLPLMQAASVLGIYGLTLWAVFICTLPLVVFGNKDTSLKLKKTATIATLAGIPLLIAYTLGSWHLAMPQSAQLDGIKIRIVQPSVPQRDKWIAEKQPAIFAEHLNLSKQDQSGQIDNLNGISHVIWPEAAMPFGPLDHPEALSAIGQMLPPNVILVTGALRQERNEHDGTRKAYNSLMAFGEQGRLVALYDKIHLVPFGEYLPFQPVLEAIGLQNLTRQRGGFTKGATPKPLMTVPGLPPITPMICYEAIFPDEVAQGMDRPGLILIVTNDGWFGNSTGPYQHFHQARIRAVEHGIPVIRAANNGISGVIDPEGRILKLISLNHRGSIDSTLPLHRLETLYARWGDLVFLLNLFIFAAVAGRLNSYQIG